MKNILFILPFLSFVNLFGQALPSDSIILYSIYGNTDTGGKTYSRALEDEEADFSYNQRIVYRVVFKDQVRINNKDLVLAIIEAPNANQHGHILGYQEIYFINPITGGIDILASVKSDGEIPLGDNSAFEIVDIGKNKKALICQFQSTGNGHFEKTKYINLLEVGKLTYMLTIHSEYDNSAWKIPLSDDEDCSAEKYTEEFEILKSDKEWFDIQIHHINYKFSKGCGDSFVETEKTKLYKYVDDGFRYE